ncbi:sphingolipid C(9)-methyltransferase [Malassezia sp. CBS 17886]|nr:sphingolipid C(9)-methyltransferase [Malassezia sp. CBS 17886]
MASTPGKAEAGGNVMQKMRDEVVQGVGNIKEKAQDQVVTGKRDVEERMQDIVNRMPSVDEAAPDPKPAGDASGAGATASSAAPRSGLQQGVHNMREKMRENLAQGQHDVRDRMREEMSLGQRDLTQGAQDILPEPVAEQTLPGRVAPAEAPALSSPGSRYAAPQSGQPQAPPVPVRGSMGAAGGPGAAGVAYPAPPAGTWAGGTSPASDRMAHASDGAARTAAYPAPAVGVHTAPAAGPATVPATRQASGPAPGASAPPPSAAYAPGGKVRLTNYATIKNAVLPVEGNGSFSNVHLALLIFFTPAVLLRVLPFVKPSWFGWPSYMVLVALFGVPVAVLYWTYMSMYGARKNEKVTLPGRPVEYYLDIKDPKLRAKYHGNHKIPMEVFYEAYFDGKIDVKQPMLDVLEYRWDWAEMVFTPALFKYVLFKMLPVVLLHSSRQDEEQIRDNYDRGDDFHEWFLGPQMVYTGGIISDPHREETLEELQDNKMALVCSKLALKPTDKVLDVGCGWGTLAAFAAKNYGCDYTGVTLARNQAEFGKQRLEKNGIAPEQARILCLDYRDIPVQKGHYNKIVCLEMAEHVGIRHYGGFLRNLYNLLDDDGVMVFQVAGLRPQWQYWDLIWGLFMNKYIFPGADASCALNWVIGKLENAGFEVRSCDVAGIHYSATILRWLNNWISNKAKVTATYGEKMYRIWLFFLASSVIVAREGGSALFQITVTKNLNATHRIEGVESHGNLLPRPNHGKTYVSVYK